MTDAQETWATIAVTFVCVAGAAWFLLGRSRITYQPPRDPPQAKDVKPPRRTWG